jgi:hypothetical protein
LAHLAEVARRPHVILQLIASTGEVITVRDTTDRGAGLTPAFSSRLVRLPPRR